MGYLLNHLLTESAERAPDAEAVRYENELLDYARLESRSNRLARALRDEGVAPGDRVGLHMRKDAEAIVALHAILKAGACVVPINAAMPPAKVLDIAEQCAMRCLIGSVEACRRLGPAVFARSQLDCAVVADGAAEQLGNLPVRAVGLAEAESAQGAEPLEIPTVDGDLAYVLFTSGSTGSPKGVMLSHRAVLTFVNWAAEEFGVGPHDRLSNHAPLNFDLSTFDIYAAMRSGASVIVIPEGMSAFPSRLSEAIERWRITIWYSVPSVLTLLVTRGGLGRRDLGSLRTILFAGEVFAVKHLRELMLAVPRPRYFNLYGPTETNVCTYFEVERPPEPDDRPIPIGRACANTKTLVLEESGVPVEEPGGEGLLYVGGSTVMDGYYGRPSETAAAFRANPIADGRDERLYCTGDWVRIGADGNYVFLGRRDHMVKVGGYRIELGEVEAALHGHPAIEEAVAIALPDEVLGNRICAVLVTADPELDAGVVRRHCATQLPSYMIPQEIEFRESIPRTSTDKVDRPALVAERTEVARR